MQGPAVTTTRTVAAFEPAPNPAEPATSAAASAPSATPTDAPPAVTPPRHWAFGVLTVVIGMFLGLLNSTIVNTAMSALEREFNATGVDAQWVNTAYRLGLAVAVPLSAWLGDRYGLRRMYIVCLSVLCLASALCGFADGLWSLVAFRVLQAAPAAILPVICTTMVVRMTPPEKIGRAMTVYGLGIILAPAVSPLLGGVFTEHLSWRLVFLINAPIALLGALLAPVILPKLSLGPPRRFDLAGYLALVVALAAPTLAISQASNWGWTSHRTLLLLAVGADALVLFVAIELWVRHPLLDMRVFTRRPYVVALILIQVLFGVMSAMLSYIPQFVQLAQGLTPTNTGLLLIPQGLCWLALVAVTVPLAQRFGAGRTTISGMLLLAAGSLMLTGITVDQPRPQLAMWTSLIGAGLGIALISVLATSVISLPPELVGQGMMFRTAVQRVTAPFGPGLLGLMVTAQQAQLLSERAGLIDYRGANADPRIRELQAQGPGALNGLMQRLNAIVTTETYANVFLVTGVAALLCVLAILLFRWELPRRG